MTSAFRVDFDSITRSIITDVTVRRATMRGVADDTAPVDLPARALWDTGAWRSVISEGIAEKLALPIAGMTTVAGIGGIVRSKLYDVSVTLPSGVIFPIIRAAEWDGRRDYDMLVGMDIISRGRFLIDNETGKTVFVFKA